MPSPTNIIVLEHCSTGGVPGGRVISMFNKLLQICERFSAKNDIACHKIDIEILVGWKRLDFRV